MLNVGYFDDTRQDWYHYGEYESYDEAEHAAHVCANWHNTQARITDQVTGEETFFEPTPYDQRVTYRKVDYYWVAWQGNKAIWEDTTDKKLLAKLKEMGYKHPMHTPLTIIKIT